MSAFFAARIVRNSSLGSHSDDVSKRSEGMEVARSAYVTPKSRLKYL